MSDTTSWSALLGLLLALTALAGLLAVVARRRASALSRSEEQYRLLFEGNPHPMWVFDLTTFRFLAVNYAALQKYGHSRDEFLSMTIRDIRPPEDVPRLIEDIARSPDTLHSSGIWRHRTRDGHILLVEISGQMLEFNGRQACLILAVDVTQREQNRREIEWQRDRLQCQAELIDLSHDAIITASSEGIITGWNRGAEKLYGWSKAEAVGRALRDLLPPPPSPDIDAALQHQRHWEGELQQSGRDGNAVSVDSRQILRCDPAGAPDGILRIDRDLTANKELEEQLHQAQKLESIGHLAGGVAHDFNNLMTIVSGYAGMALDDLAPEHPLRASMDEIVKASDRATALTRQLLTFGCRQVRSAANMDLVEVLQSMEKTLQRWVGDQIALTLSLDSVPAVVHADRAQIEQVIQNLVINARDAMPGGGTLVIEAARMFVDHEYAGQHLSLYPGWYVLLSVTDTGAGMSPEVRQHCFEPFFTTKDAVHGRGLGLSTVYGIVKQSEGACFVESEAGRGTTFKVFLPAVEGLAQPVETAPEASSLAGTETILVVEDEDGLRKYVRDTLERRGYTVVATNSGREALKIARTPSRSIDLLLTDMVMPEMGGAELAEAFLLARPHVPVLRMSGYSERLWRGPEALDFVQKPFTPSMLLTRIRTLLGKAGNN